MDKSDISLAISAIAMLTSVLSALYMRYQTLYVRYQARRGRLHDARPLMDALNSMVEEIEKAENDTALQNTGLRFVAVIKDAELALMPSVRKKVHKLIDGLWDAVHEKEPYLKCGGGTPLPGGGWIRPQSKMDAFKAQVLV